MAEIWEKAGQMQVLDETSIHAALLSASADLLAESGQSAIVLDLQGVSSLSEHDRMRVRQWCRRQPCPIIGKGHECSPASTCVDAVAETDAELDVMLRRIAANPQAATVLVQVLRAIEHMPPQDGLIVESLAYSTLQSGEEFQRWLTHHQSRNPAPPPLENGPPVLLDRKVDRLDLTLNRPASHNAYSTVLRDALVEAFSLVEMDTSIRQVRVTAAGRIFCSGGELTEFGKVDSPLIGHLIRSQASPASLLLAAADRYHFHVHGACIGSGIELPAFAGHLSAADKTLFWLPELSMGLIPGAGGCVSISRRIGRQRTAYMVLLNKKIDARKALEWGLIDEIIPEND